MNKYVKGTIMNLYENDNREYIVLRNSKIEEKEYLTVAPIERNPTEIKIKYDKLFVLYHDENVDEFDYVKDENIISKVVQDLLDEDLLNV